MTLEDVHMEDLVDSTTDWSSSDSDDSNLDELLNDNDMEMMLILFDMKQMEDRAKLLDQRNSYLDCFCMANEFLLILVFLFSIEPTRPKEVAARRKGQTGPVVALTLGVDPNENDQLKRDPPWQKSAPAGVQKASALSPPCLCDAAIIHVINLFSVGHDTRLPSEPLPYIGINHAQTD
jgi:hypothetical protein